MAKVIFSTTWQLSLGETGVTSSDPHTNWATSSDPSALAELWLSICGRPQVWYHSGLSESSRVVDVPRVNLPTKRAAL